MRKIISAVALLVTLSCSVYAGEMQFGVTSNAQSDVITQIIVFLSVLPL
jgi:hypothetical protein